MTSPDPARRPPAARLKNRPGARLRTRPLATLLAGAATALIAAVAAVVPVAPSVADAPSGHARHHARPRHLDLPDGFAPEGIAARHGVAYLGSREVGDIYRLDLATGRGRIVSRGPGTPSLGLKIDRFGNLFVAGGSGGDARVVDPHSGRILRSYTLVPSGTDAFINDVILTRDAAWFTDSLGANLYRLPLRGYLHGGRLPHRCQVRRVPLTGDWTQIAGANNANGITTTPDGRALLVVNSSTGGLFRVTRNGRATAVDLGGHALTDGDGLLREGRTLFVVQNRQNQVAVLHLSRSGRRGVVTRTITSGDFDVPSTITRSGGRLYLPNARFTTTATALTPYWVTSVRP